MRLPTTNALLQYLRSQEHHLLYIFLANVWFRVALGLCLLGALIVPIVSSNIWTSTPAHVKPAIRISTVDWLRARTLEFQARSESNQQAPEALLMNLKIALSSHPGSLPLSELYLTSLIQNDRTRIHWADGTQNALWNLTLAQTNQTSVELACRVFTHYKRDDLLLDVVKAYTGPCSPTIDQHYLPALFRAGDLDAFQARWRTATPTIEQDPEMALYHLATETLKGPRDAACPTLPELEAAKKSESTAETAYRLQLAISHHFGHLDSFRAAFEQLIGRFEDQTLDHRLYWELLIESGEIATAQKAAQDFVYHPQNATEVVAVADTITKMGLRKLAYHFLESYAGDFEFSQENWFAQSRLLVQSKEWKQLERLAVAIRSAENVSTAYIGFGYFLECQALLSQGRKADAETALNHLGSFPLVESDLGLHVGSSLWELGYAQAAFDTLTAERARYRNSHVYWDLMLTISQNLRLGPHIQIAAENLYRLGPKIPQNQINYANSLICQRIQKDRALQLTELIREGGSELPLAKILHGQALLLNERYTDAKTVLGTVDVKALELSEKQKYHLARTELYFRLNQLEKARQESSLLKPESLAPSEQAWAQSLIEALAIDDFTARIVPEIPASTPFTHSLHAAAP